jgi:hypothetical protein
LNRLDAALKRLYFCLCLAVPGMATASQVSDELGVGTEQPTATSPRAGFVYDRLGALFNLTDVWGLRGDLMLTHDDATPAQAGAAFGSSGGNIPFADVGVEFSPTEHILSSLELDFSPKSKQFNDAPIEINAVTGGTLTADANLSSVTSSYGAILTFGLDSAGDSNLEGSVNATLGVTRFDSTQAIVEVATAKQIYDLDLLRSECRTLRAEGQDRKGCAALLGDPSNLTQARAALNATATLFQDNDVGLTFAYYFYDQDPTTVGYYSVTTAGRLGTGYQFGTGLATAPYVWTLRPNLAHWFFGRLKVDVSYQYGQYWPGQGYSHTFGARIDFKINRAWKIWASAVGQQDVDGTGTATGSSLVTFGARWRF